MLPNRPRRKRPALLGRSARFLAAWLLCGAAAAGGEPRPEEARTYVKVGTEALEAGGLDEAEEAFRLAVEADPSSEEARFGLGRVYYERGRFREALREFRRAVLEGGHTAKERPELYLWAGMAAWRAGDFAGCGEFMRPLLDDPERGGTARAYLAAALETLGRNAEAEAALPAEGPPDLGEPAAGAMITAGFDGNVTPLFPQTGAPLGSSAFLGAEFMTDLPGREKREGLEASAGYTRLFSLEENSLWALGAAWRRGLGGGGFLRAGLDYLREDSGKSLYEPGVRIESRDPPDDDLERPPEWSAGLSWRLAGDPADRDGDGPLLDGSWRPGSGDGGKGLWMLDVAFSAARDSRYSYIALKGGFERRLWKGAAVRVRLGPRFFPRVEDGTEWEAEAFIFLRRDRGPRDRFEAAAGTQRTFSARPNGSYSRFVCRLSWTRAF